MTPEDWTGLTDAQRAEKLAEALQKLLERDRRNTCTHEETHRGGAIWEFCDHCGMKWADDEGGRPEWSDPIEWTISESALASYRASLEAAPVLDAEAGEDGWIPWEGGKCPIPGVKAGEFSIKFRSGEKVVPEVDADDLWWGEWDGSPYMIVAYRLHKEPR